MFPKGYFFSLRCAVAVVVLRSRRTYESNESALQRLRESLWAAEEERHAFRANVHHILQSLEGAGAPQSDGRLEDLQARKEPRDPVSSLVDLMIAKMKISPTQTDPNSPALLAVLRRFEHLSPEDQHAVALACTASKLTLSEDTLRPLLATCLAMPCGRGKLRLGCAVNSLFSGLKEDIDAETIAAVTSLLLSKDYSNVLVGANVARTTGMKCTIEKLMEKGNSAFPTDPAVQKVTQCYEQLLASPAYWLL